MRYPSSIPRSYPVTRRERISRSYPRRRGICKCYKSRRYGAARGIRDKDELHGREATESGEALRRREAIAPREATQDFGGSGIVRTIESMKPPDQIQPHGQLHGRETIEFQEATQCFGGYVSIRNREEAQAPDSSPMPTTWARGDRIQRSPRMPRIDQTPRS